MKIQAQIEIYSLEELQGLVAVLRDILAAPKPPVVPVPVDFVIGPVREQTNL